MTNINKIKLQPHASATIDLMRFNGYSLELAIADIIDNSLPVNSKNINITVQRKNGKRNDLFVLIEDDGMGMNESELEEAMDLSAKDLNSERDKNDLGKFGLGLKSASFSQCLDLLVISKRRNTEIKAMQWDLNFVKENNDWSVNVLEHDDITSIQNEFNIKDKQQGTAVLWRQCDTILKGLSEDKYEEEINIAITDLQKNLSLVYHKYISRGITIKVNGLELEAMDPFCERGSAGSRASVTFEETISLSKDDHKAKIKGYLLPHRSKMGDDKRAQNVSINGDLLAAQGIYFYRVDRLISWGSWHNLIRKSEANSLARVEISVGNNCDSEWSIEIKKSSINLPIYIKKRIRALVLGTTEKSNNVGVRRVKQKPSEYAIWQRELNKDNGTYQYSINKNHSFFKSYMDKHNIDKDIMISILDLIETTIPIEDIQNDIAQKTFKIGSPSDGLFESIIEKALTFKELGVSFEDYKETMGKYVSYNLSNEQVLEVNSTIEKRWENK